MQSNIIVVRLCMFFDGVTQECDVIGEQML